MVAGPGALLRHARLDRRDRLLSPLTRHLVAGSAPGVVLGAVLRVFVVSDPRIFTLVAAAVLLPTGLVVLLAPLPRADRLARLPLAPRPVGAAAFAVGMVGGLYGIGGGSLLGHVLVGAGMTASEVAPAALTSTFITSVVGVAAFAVLQAGSSGPVVPDWVLGIACRRGARAGRGARGPRASGARGGRWSALPSHP